MIAIILFRMKWWSYLLGVFMFFSAALAAPNQVRIADYVLQFQKNTITALQGQKLRWKKQISGEGLTFIGWSGEVVLVWSNKYKSAATTNAIIIYGLQWRTGKEIWRSLELTLQTPIELSGRILVYRVGSGAFAISDYVIRDSQTGRLLLNTRSDRINVTAATWWFESSAGGIGNQVNLEIFNPQTFEQDIFRFLFSGDAISYPFSECVHFVKRRIGLKTIEYIVTAPCGKTGFVYFKFPLDDTTNSKVVRLSPKVTVHQPPILEWRYLSRPEFP